jgi:hypothetical protein
MENSVENNAKPNRYRGLMPPFKKGEKRKPGPGRPRFKDLVAELRSIYLTESQDGKKALRRLVKQLEKRKPDEIAHYLAGKPTTSIELSGPASGPIQVNTTTQADLDKELTTRGVFLPS